MSNYQMQETKKDLVLDEDTVKHNFDVIRNLQPFQKLTINRKGKMTLDERYMQFIRRALTWDCKYDVLLPLESTFALSKETEDEKIKVLNNFSASVKQTYPAFDDLHNLIKKISDDCKKINIELDLENGVEYSSNPTTPTENQTAPPVAPPAPPTPNSNQTGCAVQPGSTGVTGVCGKTSFRDALLSGSLPHPSHLTQPPQQLQQPPIVPPTNQKTNDLSTTPMHMSAEMCEFLNISPKTKLARKEIQVMMNAYIVNKKCLDMDTKMITPDDKLSRLLGCKSKIPLTNFKSFYERHILQ